MEGNSHNDNDLLDVMFDLRDDQVMFQYLDDTNWNGVTFKANGRDYVNFATCSYMTLESEESIKTHSQEAVAKYGTQISSSRAVLSSYQYQELEMLLGQIFPGKQIVTPTTTLGHFSVLPLLVGEDDAIILDSFVHNSVRMASQVCQANGTLVLMAKHNDFENVKYLVYRLKKQGKKKIWYCGDGLYSMHGDFCKAHELLQLLEQEDQFYAYMDEAHSIGWIGEKGRGFVLNEIGLHEKMIIAASFAKSFGASGGAIITANNKWYDQIRYTGQTLIFSGPITPPVLGALIGSAKFHLSDDFKIEQNKLTDLIHFFIKRCQEINVPIASTDITPIKLLKIGNVEKTREILRYLHQKGFYALAATYPAVPVEESGIRITLTRKMSKQHVSDFIDALAGIL